MDIYNKILALKSIKYFDNNIDLNTSKRVISDSDRKLKQIKTQDK